MIDTVRFKLPFLSDTIKKKLVKFEKTDQENNRSIFCYYSKLVNLGSFDAKVNIIYDDIFHCYYLEFSAPKYYYGHNIYLLYPEEYFKNTTKLYYDLVNYFGTDFPRPSLWEYQRIDVCYAWKFESSSITEVLLSFLKTLSVPRKEMLEKPTSMMWKGKIYSTKFYLKNDEYYVHDFKEIKKKNLDRAYQLLDFSKNVLRFEATIRKEALKSYVGEDLRYDKIKKEDFEYLLHTFFNKTMSNISGEFQTGKQIFELLRSRYKKTKAVQLYAFYCLYHSDKKEDREILKSTYSRSQRFKNLASIKEANVGIKISDVDFNSILSIPSSFVVNEPPAPAVASGSSFLQGEE